LKFSPPPEKFSLGIDLSSEQVASFLSLKDFFYQKKSCYPNFNIIVVLKMVSHHLLKAVGIIVSVCFYSICLAANDTEVRERQKDGKGSILI